MLEADGFEDAPDAYEADNIFFVPPEARWSEIARAAHTPEIGTILDKAMIAIEADNKKINRYFSIEISNIKFKLKITIKN